MINKSYAFIFAAILTVILICGCVYIPPSENKADWFATVENGGPDKLMPVSEAPSRVCLEIKSKYWLPLLGPDGPGGSRESIEFWTNLEGEGPVYRDTDLIDNNPTEETHNRGTITIDKKKKKVIIDLQRIISKPGEPEKTEPNRANGAYHLKRWIQ